MFVRFFTFLLTTLIIAGCNPAPQIQPSPTVTPTPSITPTTTVIWFPPTATSTSAPILEPSPTKEMRPGVGELIFEDDFDTSTNWLLDRNVNGTAAISMNELTIAITQPGAYHFSLRPEPTLDDFYAEITASPNLCAGLDEYGLLFRVRSTGDFYRYSLSCNGQVRLDRVVNGTAGSPQTWLASASVPRGAPSSTLLGVWSVGRELRFFVNGEFQFVVSDPYHSDGSLGVFARSAGDNAVTISYSDLKVYKVRQ